MFRSVSFLAFTLLFVVPCVAQTGGSTIADPGGNPGTGSGASRDEEDLTHCTYPIDPWGIYTLNICTGKVYIFRFFEVNPDSRPVQRPLEPNFLPAVASGTGTAMGVGSEAVTGVTLAGGSQGVAWVLSTTVHTGLVPATGTAPQAVAQYTVGPTPEHVIAADFNGDGNMDLAVSNFGSLSTNAGGNIMIFLGKGDGTFTAGATVNSGGTPVAMYAADLNGDGFLDLAVGNVDPADTVSVLLGNGDGTFQPPVPYTVPISPASVVAADFNNDGHLDLAIANGYSGGVSILLGNGNGSFQPAKGYPSGNGQSTYLAWMDLNGDGKLDLIVANPQSNGVSFLFGNGDGSFQAPVEYATGAQPQYFALAIQNGQLLIRTADAVSGDLVVLPVLPGGIVGAPPVYSLPRAATGAAAGDLNGDGLPDMVAAAQTVSVMLRVPGGAFNTPVNYPLQSGSSAVAVALGDLNGDGNNDVVAASMFTDLFGNFGGTLDVAFGNGHGALGAQASYPIGGYPGGFEGAPSSGVVIGDFNGDGKPDVAAGFQAFSGLGAGRLLEEDTTAAGAPAEAPA